MQAVRTCQFPGCTTEIEAHKPSNTLWCPQCKKDMNHSRKRRWEARQKRGAEVKSVAAYAVIVPRRSPDEQPREKEGKCNWCGSMPWACEPGRYSGDSGEQVHRGEEIAPNWQCLRCGLRYEPEERVKICGSVRSSAGMAVDHGRLYGSEPYWSRTEPTGRRKGAR